MRTVLQDLRHALRLLLENPGLSHDLRRTLCAALARGVAGLLHSRTPRDVRRSHDRAALRVANGFRHLVHVHCFAL